MEMHQIRYFLSVAKTSNFKDRPLMNATSLNHP